MRFATFNASLTGGSSGQLDFFLNATDGMGNFSFNNAINNALVIQAVNPDVLLINEFDYNPANPGQALTDFNDNFLNNPQHPSLSGVNYAHRYTAPVNTGLQPANSPGVDGTLIDLNNDGQTSADGSPNDAYGFGAFPGHFGMALFSKHPVVNVRTFQTFEWTQMPGARLPDNPSTGAPNDWYNADELAIFRLSSKSHWDITLDINGDEVHVIAAHPTPPVFDSVQLPGFPPDPFAGNLVDYNGLRNADEIRLIDDYITPGAGGYIVDDNGAAGGLDPNASFVVMGDLNADPDEGDGVQSQIADLLANPRLIDSMPTSAGTPDPTDTADFGLRADYVLPSSDLQVTDSGVFWPTAGELGENAIFFTDHRLVYVDTIVPEPSAAALLIVGVGMIAVRQRRTG